MTTNPTPPAAETVLIDGYVRALNIAISAARHEARLDTQSADEAVAALEALEALITSHRALAARLAEVEAERERYREALAFYADYGTYGIECDGTNCYYANQPLIDNGNRARAALAATEQEDERE